MNKAVANLNTALGTRAVSPAASQSTTIEQSRAVAEVQSMVVVAQNCPRDEASAIQKMREACGRIALAELAFFKFPRGGSTVQGPSVHLARELARCWGNINYGVSELDRDDVAAKSEMVAYAWDVQTNARAATNFIVPHKRDKKGGAETLVDMRDIYENNANNAARRLREMIFSVLPKWFVEEAKALCRETLEKGEGEKPLTQRIADAIAALEKFGVSRERIEAKVGAKSAAWTPVDLANLAVAYRSLRSKEVTIEEEFPPIAAAKLDEALKGDAAAAGAQDAEQKVDETSADGEGEADQVAADAARSRTDDLIAGLDEMPTPADIDDYAAKIKADLDALPAAERGRFNTAKLNRTKALSQPKKK